MATPAAWQFSNIVKNENVLEQTLCRINSS